MRSVLAAPRAYLPARRKKAGPRAARLSALASLALEGIFIASCGLTILLAREPMASLSGSLIFGSALASHALLPAGFILDREVSNPDGFFAWHIRSFP